MEQLLFVGCILSIVWPVFVFGIIYTIIRHSKLNAEDEENRKKMKLKEHIGQWIAVIIGIPITYVIASPLLNSLLYEHGYAELLNYPNADRLENLWGLIFAVCVFVSMGMILGGIPAGFVAEGGGAWISSLLIRIVIGYIVLPSDLGILALPWFTLCCAFRLVIGLVTGVFKILYAILNLLLKIGKAD